MRARVGGGNAIGAVLRRSLRANRCSDCAKIWREAGPSLALSVFAASLAAVRERARSKGISGAELRLLAGYSIIREETVKLEESF